MQSILNLLSSPGWSNFIWALAHSLWIGALCAFTLGIILHRLPSDRPERRYKAGLAALACLMLGTLIAMSALDVRNTRSSVPFKTPEAFATTSGQLSFQSDRLAPSKSDDIPTVQTKSSLPWVGWFASLWLAGFTIMFIRLATQILDLRKVRKSCSELKEGKAFDTAKDLAGKMGLKKAVGIATSALTTMPAVMGVFHPVILVPLSMASGLPIDQLRHHCP